MTSEKKEKKKAVGVVYIGKGNYLAGIPARDMTVEEWKTIPASLRKHLTSVLKLYEVKYDL